VTGYQIYLLLHVVGAIAWVGAQLVMTLFAGRAAVATAPGRMLELIGDAEWLGLRVFLPSNLLVLASGVLLVHEGPWSYGSLWIRLGLAGFSLSFLTGALFFGPQWGWLAKLVEAEGIGSPAAGRRLWGLLLATGIDLGVLLAVVTAMTVKPASADRATLVVVALLPAAGAVIGVVLARLATSRAELAATAVGVPQPPV
jgi:hypothetical protein